MIFYFSATGNSRHAACRIAEAVGDRAIPVTDCLKNEKFNFIAQPNEKIGFVCPVYNLGLPVTVIDFIKKLNLNLKDNYVFSCVTFGGFSGSATKMLNSLLTEKGICVNAAYSVKMPDTWTPVYDVSDKDKIEKINKKADKTITAVIRKIKNSKNGNCDFYRLPFCQGFYKDYENMRRTETLSVNDNCIGCGKCAELCPVDAIEMRNGKPVWVKEKCAMCLGCLHRCPEFAIHRGKKTALHGQYTHE
ncbi:MAG: EFR1 family ferrodoxin [Clostridia bacterium]|nr:EFR1 family ferrodoxin [Clostridia bacterium]